MKKITALLMSTVALAASIEVASAGAKHPIISSVGSDHHAHAFVHKNKLKTLYDQDGTDEGIGIVSQNFESSFDAYDSQGADDFVVPANTTWYVEEVDVTGVYFNGSGPATSENVFFYKNSKKNLPGKALPVFAGILGTDNGTGSFSIALPGKGQKLKAGLTPVVYWVSVQANMDFNHGGEWGWEKQTTVVGNRAAWQNPGDGFATGCTTWGIEDVCIPEGPGAQPIGDDSGDKMYALKGKTKSGTAKFKF